MPDVNDRETTTGETRPNPSAAPASHPARPSKVDASHVKIGDSVLLRFMVTNVHTSNGFTVARDVVRLGESADSPQPQFATFGVLVHEIEEHIAAGDWDREHDEVPSVRGPIDKARQEMDEHREEIEEMARRQNEKQTPDQPRDPTEVRSAVPSPMIGARLEQDRLREQDLERVRKAQTQDTEADTNKDRDSEAKSKGKGAHPASQPKR